MTIIEAINQIDEFKPNGFSQKDKIRWLNTVDYHIKTEIIDTHEDAESVIFAGYDEDTPLDTALLADAPFDVLYIRWLEAQIDYANAEIGKYNNSMTMFDSAYSDYKNYYNRTHMPQGKKIKYFSASERMDFLENTMIDAMNGSGESEKSYTE